MRRPRNIWSIFLLAFLLAATVLPAAADDVPATFLYKLSNFNGVIPFMSPKLYADPVQNELYVMSGGTVSIFSSTGMETYKADYDPERGTVLDMASDEHGNLLMLTSRGTSIVINVCNFRLEPHSTIELQDLPSEYRGFIPAEIKVHDGRLYLAAGLKVIVTDMKGKFIKGYNLFEILGVGEFDEKAAMFGAGGRRGKSLERIREEHSMEGFSVGPQGDMLFTLPVLGKAGVLTPDGKATLFGTRGSGPGKMSIPNAILDDGLGHYLVADKLRCIILVYDKSFSFRTEFGSLGARDAWMVGPNSMVMDGKGRLYVGQIAKRGVNVYQMRSSDE